MQTKPNQVKMSVSGAFLLAGCVAVVLSACGGGSNEFTDDRSATVAAPLASGVTVLALESTALADDVANLTVQPTFQVAPMFMDEPDDADANGNATSARRTPHTKPVPDELDDLSTHQLTTQTQEGVRLTRLMRSMSADGALPSEATVSPMAAGSVVATYTPAQIRAAYGLPALPSAGAVLSPAQAAMLGAGQTIYVIGARHNPNAAAELAAFNQKFGLPTCTTKAISTSASLPLPAASTSGCEFSVVYNNANGAMTTTAPLFDAGWSTEMALDVQWAHATAPLARIILIEAADPMINNLLGSVKLANAMGPGAVSMSFGTLEGSWTASVDSAFSASNMTYLAATGDSGAAVSWPAVSTKVLAVGGTSLTYTGVGVRSEVGCSGTGGGTSLYTPVPVYQNVTVPGMGGVRNRTVADVAFNADPATGQYVAVITPGSSAVKWISAGGTSLSTPQWAGLIAIANGVRALSAKPALGTPHAVLYGQIATVPGTYASAFADITRGLNGSCVTCASRVGYDPLSGLGTPNVTSLVSALSGASVPAAVPVVSSASIRGQVGTSLSFTALATASNPLTYALGGAPSGMSIGTTGVVTWGTPLAGTYSVTVIAKDSKTGMSGQGVYTISIAAQQPPVVGAANISGRPGVALSFSVSVSTSNAISYTLSGAPSGMSISSAGLVSWAKPVLGTYKVTVIAKDTKTGLTGQGVYTVAIATAGPVITAPAVSGVAGKSLTGFISISDAGATSLSVSISGAPLGMGFSVSGQTIKYVWASPATGSYALKVSVLNSAGLSAQATVAITVTAK